LAQGPEEKLPLAGRKTGLGMGWETEDMVQKLLEIPIDGPPGVNRPSERKTS
jgi:hypothetical protein